MEWIFKIMKRPLGFVGSLIHSSSFIFNFFIYYKVIRCRKGSKNFQDNTDVNLSGLSGKLVGAKKRPFLCLSFEKPRGHFIMRPIWKNNQSLGKKKRILKIGCSKPNQEHVHFEILIHNSVQNPLTKLYSFYPIVVSFHLNCHINVVYKFRSVSPMKQKEK